MVTAIIASVIGVLAGIGFAKPVPVNSRYFKHYRRDVILVSAAGPASNLCLSLIFLLLLRFVGYGWLARIPVPYDSLRYFLIYFTLVFLYYGVYLNVSLAVFNLLPLPPLDGYHVLNDLVLKRPLFADQKATMVGTVILYGLFFTDILDKVLAFLQNFIFTNIGSLAGAVYSLFGII